MIKLGNLKSASEICLCGFVELTPSGKKKKKKYIYIYIHICTTVNIPILKQILEMPFGLSPPTFG